MLAATLGSGEDAEAVMLIRWRDDSGSEQVSAVSAACTHLGAQLPNGLRTGDLVRCPFHHACFDLRTGEAVLAPAFTPLTRYDVVIDGQGQDAMVRVGDTPGAVAQKQSEAGSAVPSAAPRRVVVLGGGAAGFAAVERLRREGYAGELVLVSAEPHLPIDRTLLSKNFLAGATARDGLPLLPADWYAAHRVELRLGVTVTSLDPAEHQVHLRDSGAPAVLDYDSLLLATGAEPTRPDLPGLHADDVHVLRTRDDADALIEALGPEPAARRVVILGAGFIGLEVAASLRQREVDVAVVAGSAVPLHSQLGETLGLLVRGVHEEDGVRFVTGRAAGWAGGVLTLEDGRRVPAGGSADLLVLGTGVAPRAELARDAGLDLAGQEQGGGVVVDARGRTSAAGIWAAGDVAAWPDPTTGHTRRIEHWAQAQRQGAAAALDVLGLDQVASGEPAFFWTKQFTVNVRLAGEVPDLSADGGGTTEVDGDVDERSVLVRYRDAQGRVTAVGGVGRDGEVLRLEEELLRH